MFKTIFIKQFLLYLGALLISFIIMAVSFRTVSYNYFVSQKARILNEQALRVARTFQTNIYGEVFYNTEELSREIEVLNDYLNSSLIFINDKKQIELVSNDIARAFGKKLQTDEFDKAFKGEIITSIGNVSGIFKQNVLTVAMPIYVSDEVFGVILLSSSMPELQKTSKEMFKITLICLLISSVIAFALIFLFSKTLTKPLREMNQIAKDIAGGDFYKRIDVKSKDEIGELSKTLNFMAESLYEQDKTRRVFIGNISHDIRSPLTSIRGFLQAILDGTITEDKKEHYLQIVMQETERLSKLTHDIIDLNNIQSSEIELQKTSFDINELIRQTLILFESLIINKDLHVSLNFASEVTHVFCDKEKIQRVLYNLIDNAIKFSYEKTSIQIETTLESKKVKISVKNEGCGIKPEEEKQIFERFYKADFSRGEDKEGSGLGLSIVSTFLKAHGESISVKSIEGEEAEFIFSLPLYK